MRKLTLALALLWLAGGLALAGEGKGKDGNEGKADKTDPGAGLVAHYFKDPTEWDGKWKEGEKPTVDPKEFTFREYRYSRVEPLINHLFIHSGWFSVRWVGYVKLEAGLDDVKGKDKKDAAPLGTEPVEVTFELWMDDGARLFVDGQKLIDDWRACAETEADSHRKATVKLAPGPHRIVVEYFQGESLKAQDHDPAKLYWECPALGIKRKIISAAHFYHTDKDLEDYEPSTAVKEEPAQK
jgi:hypothetical protein